MTVEVALFPLTRSVLVGSSPGWGRRPPPPTSTPFRAWGPGVAVDIASLSLCRFVLGMFEGEPRRESVQ